MAATQSRRPRYFLLLMLALAIVLALGVFLLIVGVSGVPLHLYAPEIL